MGGFGHPPNEDAAVWFVTEVLPLVRRQVPAAHLLNHRLEPDRARV